MVSVEKVLLNLVPLLVMGKLSNEELEVVYKNGWKPSEYVESRDG